MMVTQYIERSWEAYKNNFVTIIGAAVIPALITMGIVLLSALPLIVMLFSMFASAAARLGHMSSAEIMAGEPAKILLSLLSAGAAPFVAGVIVLIIGVIIAVLVGIALQQASLKSMPMRSRAARSLARCFQLQSKELFQR